MTTAGHWNALILLTVVGSLLHSGSSSDRMPDSVSPPVLSPPRDDRRGQMLAEPTSATAPTVRNMHFVPNVGQWRDRSIGYVFRNRLLDIAFRESSLLMHRRSQPAAVGGMERNTGERASIAGHSGQTAKQDRREADRITLTFPGSNGVQPVGVERQAARFNYFAGDDQSRWRRGVSSFGGIEYHNLYDGIDLRVESAGAGVLKYEFHCKPGADYERIGIRYDGIHGLRVDESGDLLIETAFGTLRDRAPLVWQVIDGEQVDLPARFRLLNTRSYTIEILAPVEPGYPLVIDPTVEWMTYIGGSGVEWAFGIDIDDSGAIMVTGDTSSLDFEGAINEHHGGSSDVFVARVDPSGAIDWMTFFGGSGELKFDLGRGIAMDENGNALVTGWTNSPDFAGANNSLHGGVDAFVARLDPSGDLDWMTYLGGTADDTAFDIAVDDGGGALVTGDAYSTNFEGAINSHHGGNYDAFAARVHPSGTIDWMTYLGGNNQDEANGITVDADGGTFVIGDTWSPDFDGRVNSPIGNRDAYVVRLHASGAIDWMAYLGGTMNEVGSGIAQDINGALMVVGYTTSTNFIGANNSHHGGSVDTFVARLSPSGITEWMTYLGGSGWDSGFRVHVDDEGGLVVCGRTESADFEGHDNSFHGGEADGYMARILPTGFIEWMIYLGGSGDDSAQTMVYAEGAAMVAGRTNSLDFAGANNEFHGGGSWGDAFVLKVPIDHHVTLLDFTVTLGFLIDGGLAELGASDNANLHTRSQIGFSALEPNIMEILIGADGNEFLGPIDTFAIDIESHVNNVGGTATVKMRNWNTSALETVHTYGVGQSDDTESITGVNTTNRIRPSDGRIDLAIRHVVIATFAATGFESFFDLVEIRGQ